MAIVEIDQHPGAYAPIPGPADRESFFAAQARNRRTSWRLTALSALTVLILGIPLSTVFGPLVYGTAILGVDVAGLLIPLPNPIGWAVDTLDGASIDAIPVPLPWLDSSTRSSIQGTIFLVLMFAPPGALFLLLLWLGMRTLFLRSGTAGILRSLGTREPKATDLEERQLVNLVAEMAIAAGVPPPRVLLLDTRAVNAAAVGTSLDDGVVVVSRGLLDALDREETQGIVGHLVGSIGNGDLRIAMSVLALFQTLGVVMAVLSVSFGPRARRTLRRLVRFALRRPEEPDGPAEAETLAELLAGSLAGKDLDEADDLDRQGWIGKAKGIVLLPLLAAYSAFWVNQKILGELLVGPAFTFVWRARRYLADATAVQLTRNPDGLARALLRLARPDAAVPGAGWASHLFVAWPEKTETPEADKLGIVGSLHPSLERRVRGLQAMGSTVVPPRSGTDRGLKPFAWIVASPFLLLFGGLLIGFGASTVAVSLVVDGLFFFGLFVIPLHLLLRHFAR